MLLISEEVMKDNTISPNTGTLPPLDVSLVTRNNYSCYVKGNECVYQLNSQLSGYQDRKSTTAHPSNSGSS